MRHPLRLMNSIALASWLTITSAAQTPLPPPVATPTQASRQGTADLGLGPGGVRLGPGMSEAMVGDASYHTGAIPRRMRVLAWGDTSQGYQHDSVSHALTTIERLGYETGTYDTIIKTDSQLITKHKVLGADGEPLVYAKNLNDFDAIFFVGSRELLLTPEQKADLLSFVRDDGKAIIVAHSGSTAFFSWPEFGDMVGGRFDDHPWGIFNAPVIVEDPNFPGMSHVPTTFDHTDEFYQIKDLSREKVHVILRLDVSHLDMTTPLLHHHDQDFPLVWAKTYGKGRVYYSALGHDPSNWDDRAVQEMYFEAIKWGLRLENADVTPRPFPASSTAAGAK
jgi:type 1 glutamine amidotransferase